MFSPVTVPAVTARLAWILAAVALALPAAAGAEVSPRIVNGQPVAAQDLPYVAGLQLALESDPGGNGDAPDVLCAGSLIAARWILTAAHCLAEEPVDIESSYAVLGATNLNTSTPDQHYALAEGFFPEAYLSGNGNYDVGLIRLARPAPQPQLRLLRVRDAARFAPGTNALTAGWGYTEDPEDGGRISSDQLRAVDLQIYPDQQCAEAFADAAEDPNQLDFTTELCALAPNKDSCVGDSGGPLIVDDGTGQPALAGAVSFGIGSGNILRGDRSCNEGPPGVYAKVGADPLNAFVRERVPQVEVDPEVESPVPGERVTFTAHPHDPDGGGRFGGYDALAWDLDGDGVFGEGRNERVVTKAVPPGTSAVSVRASSADGDAEVRTIRLTTQAKSAVAFTRAKARVRAGRSVVVRIRRIGTGAGSARVTVSGRGVRPRARALRFSGNEAARTLRLRTGLRASRKVTVRLGAFSGDVIAGARTKLVLRVRGTAR
jgi:secreted trypsin-like serine protease